MNSTNVPDILKNYQSFIVWRLEQKPGKAKPDKIPYNPRTGQLADTTNPNTWSDYDTAVRNLANGYDGIGFVFSHSDPFFFIDIDGAWNGARWSDTAETFGTSLQGASAEVSQSGTGLHYIGYCDKQRLSDRRNVFRVGPNSDKIEFYITGRFMAVGRGNWNREPDADLTAVLQALIPIREVGTEAAEYSGPRQGYAGPASDDELIAKMLSTRSASSVFGGKATFEQLWNADAAALAAVWPDANNTDRPFDHSSADAALMAHLAFWTGADGERMERLFSRSALGQRDKWKERADYRVRTTLGAIAKCQRIYDFVPTTNAAKTPETINGFPVAMQQQAGELGGILTPEEQADYFDGCIAVSGMGRIMTPQGQFFDSVRFNMQFGGKIFVIDNNGKTTDEPWKAATRGQVFKLPVVQETCFRPDLPKHEITTDDLGRRVVNIFVPVNIKKTDGDTSPFMRHLIKLFPVERDRQILLAYMAACVQYPGRKFQWCPVIQGVEGNGKTFLMSAVSYTVGERYVHSVNANELGDAGTKFNSWLYGKLLIVVEEIFVKQKFHVLEALKPLITNTRIEFQAKGQDQFTGDNRANFLMATNHKDAIPVGDDKRRWAVFYSAQQSPEDMVRDGFIFPDRTPTDYMKGLWDWFNHEGGKEAVAGMLSSYQIPDEFNPAGMLHRAPHTSSYEEAKSRSVSPIEEMIRDAIEDDMPGFRGGWLSAWALEKMMTDTHLKLPRRVYRDVLAGMGYIPHPLLNDGRSTIPIMQEGGRKPRIYVLKDNQMAVIEKPAENYMRAQGYI